MLTTTSILEVFQSSFGADAIYVATTFLDSSISSISRRKGVFSLRATWAITDSMIDNVTCHFIRCVLGLKLRLR